MPKKLILTLAVFFLALCSLAYAHFFYAVKKTTAPKSEINKQVLSNTSDSFLAILPNPLITNSSTYTSVDVVLDTKSAPTLVQLEISFDRDSLTNISISEGDYFINPELSLEKTDFKNGRISYAVGGKSTNPESNIVARIYFTPVNYNALKKQTELKFLPKTSIKQNGAEIKLKEVTPGLIIINPGFFAPVASPSAIPLPS